MIPEQFYGQMKDIEQKKNRLYVNYDSMVIIIKSSRLRHRLNVDGSYQKNFYEEI